MENRNNKTKEQWNEIFNLFIQPNPYITEWELGFCKDLFNQNKQWSEKQANVLDGIKEKRIKPYIKLLKKQQNGYCKPTTLRVMRYNGK